MRTPGFPIRFSRTPSRVFAGAPLTGEHSRSILAELGHEGARRRRPDRPRRRGRRPAVTAFRGSRGTIRAATARSRLRRGAAVGAIDIAWETQSLEGFESASDPRARAHLRPDRARPPAPRRGRRRRLPRAGRRAARRRRRSSASRRRRSAPRRRATSTTGRSYALPLDAATQVQVLQPALVGDRPAPATWDEVLELAAEHPLALSRRRPARAADVLLDLRRPGGRGARSTAEAPVPAALGVAALELMQRLDAVAVDDAARREPDRDPRGDGDAAGRRLLPARLRLRQLRARRAGRHESGCASPTRRCSARCSAARASRSRGAARSRPSSRATSPGCSTAPRRRPSSTRTRASRRRAPPGSTRRSTSAPAASTRPRAGRSRQPGCARASRATSSSRRAPRS